MFIRFILFFSILFSLNAKPCSFSIAKLHYNGGGDWYSNPSSLPNLVEFIKKETNIPICDTIPSIQILDNNLFNYPFLYMTGHGNVHFSKDEKIRLRKYLINGGFLWADDNFGLDKSFRHEIAALFPENKMVELQKSHKIFNSKFHLNGLPKIHEHNGDPAQAFGVYFNNTLIILYTYSSDIGDGMEDLHVHNDGKTLHEIALKMGTNILFWFFNP